MMFDVHNTELQIENNEEWQDRVFQTVKTAKEDPNYNSKHRSLKLKYLYNKFYEEKGFNDAVDGKKSSSVSHTNQKRYHHSEEKLELPKIKGNQTEVPKEEMSKLCLTDDSNVKSEFQYIISPSSVVGKEIQRRYQVARRNISLGSRKDLISNSYIKQPYKSVFATQGSLITSMTTEEASILQDRLASVLWSGINGIHKDEVAERTYQSSKQNCED